MNQNIIPNVSSFHKLKRIIVHCLELTFCRVLLGVLQEIAKSNSSSELKKVEIIIIRNVQNETFFDEINDLQTHG